jgi:hypothetical protein
MFPTCGAVAQIAFWSVEVSDVAWRNAADGRQTVASPEPGLQVECGARHRTSAPRSRGSAAIPKPLGVAGYAAWGYSPTFGSVVLFFFRKTTTRSYNLMNFSESSLRGAEMWHVWKQHHVIERIWKIMKSIFHIRSMQLQGDGLYTALLTKVLSYLLALRLQAEGVFSKLTITQIMRKLRREEELGDFLTTHFQVPFSIT